LCEKISGKRENLGKKRDLTLRVSKRRLEIRPIVGGEKVHTLAVGRRRKFSSRKRTGPAGRTSKGDVAESKKKEGWSPSADSGGGERELSQKRGGRPSFVS